MEKRFLKSQESATSGDHNSEVPACAVCGGKEWRNHRLTWQLSRQDLKIENDVAVKEWMERRQGLPSVLVLPDDGGVLAYSVDPYCDGCLDRYWREYEERHTPVDRVNRAAFLEKIRTSSLGSGWAVYTLELQYLSPRGFPNLALIRDDQLLLGSVRGDVTARTRAFHPPGHSLIISPEVPQGTREALLRDQNEGVPSEKLAFLYMDERYSDTKSPTFNAGNITYWASDSL